MTDREPSAPPVADACRLKQLGRAVIEIEARTLAGLVDRIDDAFVAAARHMLACRGRIVVLGMGKSGHIGSKFAATLASTGTPAFFVHPGEASHGDMGMITTADVVFALSNSGETDELRVLVPLIKRLGVPLIAMTGNPRSTLAEAASVHLYVPVAQEACPLGLAPTSSTTAALAMGDALAVALLEARGFTQEDFARSHPGGALGRRLLLKIRDLMHQGEQMPVVHPDTRVVDALLEMTRKGLGLTAVVGADGRLAGIFTDGDLRRALDRGPEVLNAPVAGVMTRRCRTGEADMLAAEALRVMQEAKINALLVVDGERTLVGVLNMHDLLKAKVL
ncbi:MAG TPA: KpsF/GutQ family sugar-phosphate isomerase [Gammaproteobacteria bacterium]|nr:KpsF/GutQ family sugar-phosphate isomerase [Gammaproteobacteria bacterium]